MTTPTTPAAARVAFERDAEPMGFDLRRHECMVPEPWSEYHDINTGHRWGGYLAATHAAAARESALIAERDALRAEVAELMRAALQAARQPQAQQVVAEGAGGGLRQTLIDVGRVIAWQCFGDCRAYDEFGPGSLRGLHEMDAEIRAALATKEPK